MFARIATLSLFASLAAFSQTGQITGLITDPAGTTVPGAAITITNVDTGIRHESVSNDQGYYTVLFLNPGN